MIAWARGPAEEQLNQLSAVGPTTSGPSRTLIGFDSNSFRECVGQLERIQQQLAVHLILDLFIVHVYLLHVILIQCVVSS